MFDLCTPLMAEPKLVARHGDFPLLTGQFQSHQFALEAFPDTIGYRKIPSLWMQVTLATKLPVNGTVDILARAQNIEFFSPSPFQSTSPKKKAFTATPISMSTPCLPAVAVKTSKRWSPATRRSASAPAPWR